MRIDASSLISMKPELVEMLKNLEIGDALKGRVLEALGNSIAVRAASGQIFTAVLAEGQTVPKGTYVELTVSNIIDGKIYAQLQSESKPADLETKVSELLKQLNLPVDEKNMEAAKLLIKYNLPLNKDVISNITGLQKSIDSLNQSTEGRIGLMLSGLDIKNTPVDVLNKIVVNWAYNPANTEAEQQNYSQLENILEGSIYLGKESQEAEQPIDNTGKQKAVTGGNANETTGSLQETAGVPEKSRAEINKGFASGADVLAASKDSKPQTEADERPGLLKALEKLGIEPESEVRKFAGQIADALSSIKSADMEAITYLISKDMEATPKNLGMLMKNIENTDGISQFLDKLQQKIEASDNPELKDIKDSIKKLFLEPRQLEDSKEVSEQFKDIAKLGEKLESYLNRSGNQDPEIREALTNLRDNIDFIRNINEYNNYIQLPLLMNGDTSTAKLYVFKEGKRTKAINPENATVLVALDLKNLGHLESLVGINRKTVNVTFRVENKGIGSLFEKQSYLLKDLLKVKGYSLGKVRVIDLEQPFNLISLEAAISESVSEKIHFDMRI